MPVYSSTLIPPLVPPRVDADFPDLSTSKDDRIKIAEVEAAFEKFENELSTQCCHNIIPIGKRMAAFSSGSEDFVLPGTCHITRTGPIRGTLSSPYYINDSLTLDSDMNDLDFSNSIPLSSRTSGSRLPRRVVAPRSAAAFPAVPFHNFTPSTSFRRPPAYLTLSPITRTVASGSSTLNPCCSSDSQAIRETGESETTDSVLQYQDEPIRNPGTSESVQSGIDLLDT